MNNVIDLLKYKQKAAERDKDISIDKIKEALAKIDKAIRDAKSHSNDYS